jgi:hypothetical protein
MEELELLALECKEWELPIEESDLVEDLFSEDQLSDEEAQKENEECYEAI